MPRNDFPVADRHIDQPISFTDIHRSVTPTKSLVSVRVPWRPVGAVASLGAPVCIGVLHPLLGEVIAATEVVVVLTIIATALFGTRTLCERAFRLLRWFGDRPEPPPPSQGTRQGIETADIILREGDPRRGNVA